MQIQLRLQKNKEQKMHNGIEYNMEEMRRNPDKCKKYIDENKHKLQNKHINDMNKSWLSARNFIRDAIKKCYPKLKKRGRNNTKLVNGEIRKLWNDEEKINTNWDKL